MKHTEGGFSVVFYALSQTLSLCQMILSHIKNLTLASGQKRLQNQ
jgi:hypothetical protein